MHLPRAAGAATLRVSVTDRCNLRCAYCMPEEGIPLVPRSEIPAAHGAGLGGRVARGEVRRRPGQGDGGEPLVRGGVPEFVAKVAAIPGVREVSMTTNGTRLAGAAAELAKAGLARVNISLDTVDPDRFRELTRGGRVEEVLAGIDAALEAGLTPLKLNSVLRRSSFREDVPALLDLAAGERRRDPVHRADADRDRGRLGDRGTGDRRRRCASGSRPRERRSRPSPPDRTRPPGERRSPGRDAKSSRAGSTRSAIPSVTTATV